MLVPVRVVIMNESGHLNKDKGIAPNEVEEEDEELGELEKKALFFGAQQGDADMVSGLLRDYPLLVTRKDNRGRSCLHVAAAHGHLEVVKAVAESKHGREALAMLDRWDATVLHAAVQGRQRVVVAYLLEQMPELATQQDSSGRCPMHVAAILGDIKVAEAMGIPQWLRLRSRSCKTVLHYAAMHKQLQFVEWVAGCHYQCFNGGEMDTDGNHALHLAMLTPNNSKVSAAILAQFPEADLRARNRQGLNPVDLCNRARAMAKNGSTTTATTYPSDMDMASRVYCLQARQDACCPRWATQAALACLSYTVRCILLVLCGPCIHFCN